MPQLVSQPTRRASHPHRAEPREVEIAPSDLPPRVYRVAITPADVGRRVAVRRVLDDGREGLGDVIGDLLGWADGTLTVRTRDNREVRIAERLVVSAKTVPPAPRRAVQP